MITKEEIKTLYERANQYCIAAFYTEPDRIEIWDDETLYARFFTSYRGQWDEEVKEIPIEKLTQDLDEVIKERKEREEVERIEREKKWEEEKRLRQQREREEELKTLKRLKEKYES